MAIVSASAKQVSNVSPTKLFDPLSYKAQVVVQNLGPNAIYLGPSNVATTTGLSVPQNGTYTFDEDYNGGPVYAIAATAAQSSPADTRVLVEPLN